MVTITVSIPDLNRALTFLTQFPNQYKTKRKNAHNTLADQGVRKFKELAHRKTGKMQSNIKKGRIDENTMEIISPIGYSGYENKRGRDHAFFNKGVEFMKQEVQRVETNTAKMAVGNR